MEPRDTLRAPASSQGRQTQRTRGTVPRRRLLAWAVMFSAAAVVSPLATDVTRAAASTFYLDCNSGNDNSPGTATGKAWRTLSRANAAALRPGDSLLLKRGCAWATTLRAKWAGTAAAPITIGAYGTGAPPLIQNQQNQIMITGTRLIIQDLAARANAVTHDAQCQNARAGRLSGFRFAAGSSYSIVRRVVASELFIGIEFDRGSHHNKALNSVARDNNMKSDRWSSDAGAVGITLMGDDNEVAFNTISGSDVCSRFYGRDGSAIEVFGGQRNRVHNNRAIDNNQFTELGNSRSADNTFAYNVVTSSLKNGHFMTTRGARDAHYGPVLRTKIYNNSVYLSGSASYAIQCTKGCGPSVLSLRNNIVWAADRIGYADARFDEGNNVYWSPGGPSVWFATSSTSRKVDPKYVAPGAGNLHLQAGSSAVNAGSTVAIAMGFKTDFDGAAVPFGGAVDVGAFERH
jgi:hypothetical protein